MKITKDSRCLEYEPDCEHCKYHDCIATYDDVKRQEAYKNEKYYKKRNENIVNAFKGGATVDGLAEKYDMSNSGILYILRQNGIKINRGRKHDTERSVD